MDPSRGQFKDGALVRMWLLETYLGQGPKVVFTFDASVWGFGGVATVNGVMVSYFATPITEDDERIHKVSKGDNKGQQGWEALAQLIGLRLWKQYWFQVRARLHMRSDNVSSLNVVLNLKASDGTISGLIARELALDLGDCAYAPTQVSHLPGVVNQLSDALSRKYAPGRIFQLPQALKEVPEATVPRRDEAYYLTL